MWKNEKMKSLKVHSVHIKINEDQFEYLNSKGNKSEYMRELIKKDMQGSNDNNILMEALRLMALKQPGVLPIEVKAARVVQSVQASKPLEPVQQEPNLLDQFGWDD